MNEVYGNYRRTFDYENYYVQEKVNDEWVTIRTFNVLSNNYACTESFRLLIDKARGK
jgi:mRNA deadenylase 3'-5' endonuclease subunit Ccr4